MLAFFYLRNTFSTLMNQIGVVCKILKIGQVARPTNAEKNRPTNTENEFFSLPFPK